MAARVLDIVSWALWWTLLVLPATTVAASQHSWDVSPYVLIAANLWTILLAWTLVGRRWFMLATWPLVVLGALLVAADLLRNVNLLELVLVGALRRDEAVTAIAPYAWACAAVALALLALACRPALAASPVRPAGGKRRRLAIAALAVVGAGMAAASPGGFLRAWPINLAALGVARVAGREDVLATMLPYAAVNPRKPDASWRARRVGAVPAAPETYVLIVGESVRADRLQACGNKRPVGPETRDLLIFCDMTSGSSSTHTSVPLLVSRESPGGLLRVSSDATFVKAFEEAGFETWWLAVQELPIAWPDARHLQHVTSPANSDAALLLGPLQRALSAPGSRKLIVLHAYNAHFNYCDRFDRSRPRWPVDCAALDKWPSSAQRPALLDAYDNAVQESMRFVDRVIDATRAQGQLAMVLYTSDHGENILDDERGLLQHALTSPTRWDTRVPAIVWASPAWKAANPTRWSQLQANVGSPTMHGDLVPTLLGAAGIRYDEPRQDVADLGAGKPKPRVRWVQRHLGQAVDADKL